MDYDFVFKALQSFHAIGCSTTTDIEMVLSWRPSDKAEEDLMSRLPNEISSRLENEGDNLIEVLQAFQDLSYSIPITIGNIPLSTQQISKQNETELLSQQSGATLPGPELEVSADLHDRDKRNQIVEKNSHQGVELEVVQILPAKDLAKDNVIPATTTFQGLYGGCDSAPEGIQSISLALV